MASERFTKCTQFGFSFWYSIPWAANHCGKSSLDALEIIKKEKPSSSEPKISKDVIIQSPDILRNNQSEFSKTGGIHASALIDEAGKVIATREDVGRHNALDKLLGHSI